MKISSSPIFIVGAPRSGTTLLQYMLRSHPNISLPTGESHFFIPLFRNADSFGDLNQALNIRKVLQAMYKQSSDFLDTDIHGIKFDIDRLTTQFKQEGRNTIAALISGLFEKNAQGEGKHRWGDKTPYYVLHMKTILQMFPDAQFIHLIRDGRDCALSMLERKHDFGVYNIFFAAKYWEIYVELGRQMGRELSNKVYQEIRYEDLLDNPKIVMQNVCHFLNEPYSDALVKFKKSGEKGKTPGDAFFLRQPERSDVQVHQHCDAFCAICGWRCYCLHSQHYGNEYLFAAGKTRWLALSWSGDFCFGSVVADCFGGESAD